MDNIKQSLCDNVDRLLASLIDIIPITLIVFGVFYLFFGFDVILTTYQNRGTNNEPTIQFIIERNKIRDISFLILIIYSIFMESSTMQGTFGKKLMGIRVVDLTGNKISLKKSTIRNLSKILSYLILGLGFAWILFDKNKQGWHDKIANTYVVKRTFVYNAAEEIE